MNGSKERRQALREKIAELAMKFMPTDEDIAALEALQREYYALLAQGGSTLSAEEKKHLGRYAKFFDRR